MNARFWIFGAQSNPVKITLKPGQVIHYRRFNRHDEGYTFTNEIYEYEKDMVKSHICTQSKDCDGIYTYVSESYCPIDNLHKGWEDDYYLGIIYPLWKDLESYQRDHTAESMGY